MPNHYSVNLKAAPTLLSFNNQLVDKFIPSAVNNVLPTLNLEHVCTILVPALEVT